MLAPGSGTDHFTLQMQQFVMPQRLQWIRSSLLVLVSLSMLLISGCGGCTSKNAGKKKKEKEKPKPNFVHLESALLPGPLPIEKPAILKDDKEENLKRQQAYDKARLRFLEKRTKRGHWFTTTTPFLANNFDQSGVLRSRLVDGGRRPLNVAGTNFSFSVARPFSLAKGEWKNLEHMVYAPADGNFFFDLALETENGGVIYPVLETQKHMTLKPYQFHFVVLSNKPDSYSYLRASDAIGLEEDTSDSAIEFYRMEYYQVGDPVPLPSNALAWTTTAYLLWDDFTPDQLSTDQQQALVDWLHFGGQLILSGPDAADKLKNSFLSPYLPSASNEARNLVRDDFKDLNQNWAIANPKNLLQKRALALAVNTSLIGIELQLNSDANFVDGTGQLVAEKRVGRGRTVMTSFSLDDTAFKKWLSVNSFINGCLLRRPPRTFEQNEQNGITTATLEEGAGNLFDPLVASSVRFISRDLSLSGTSSHNENEPTADVFQNNNYQIWNGGQALTPEELFFTESQRGNRKANADLWRFGGYEDTAKSGVAGWNDQSAIPVAARRSLSRASGITPPAPDLVLKLLAGYLVVLVPVNWLFFKLIGRVEWAWIAAPIIAIAGSVVVVKMAALDIGFVRSNNQLTLVETFGDFNRAHVTEYSAVYTSLSTGYTVEFDNPNAQSLPFETSETSPGIRRVEKEVTLNRSLTSKLKNFQVDSNTTRLLHTEYMADLDGNIRLNENATLVTNSTRFDLSNAFVFRSDNSGDLEYISLTNLKSGASSTLENWREIEAGEIPNLWERPKTKYDFEQIWRSDLDEQILETFLAREPFNKDPALFRFVARQVFEQDPTAIDTRDRTFAEIFVDKPSMRKIIENFLEAKSDFTLDTNEIAMTIAGKLMFEPGEYRLIGSMNQPVGSTNFIPTATRTINRTLFLVHLRKPALSPARPDKNCYIDLEPTNTIDSEPEDSTGLSRLGLQ